MTGVLVTGATGFVGRAVLPQLLNQGWRVRVAVRRSMGPLAAPLEAVEVMPVGDLGDTIDWQPALAGIDLVVHLAARVHVMGENGAEALARYRQVNVEGTRRLVEAARCAGVQRFLLMSSVKAVGEEGNAPLSEATPSAPVDPYGLSKLEAEEVLRSTAGEAMEWTFLRPPLVYGPGVGANFLKLLRISQRGWPLPLGAVCNRRSLVYVGNLADAVVRCLIHPGAVGRGFFVHDGEALAVADLIRRLARLYGRSARLLPVPPVLLRLGAGLLGARGLYDRVCGSLEVDDSALRRATGWSPPFTTDDGLRLTVDWDIGRTSSLPVKPYKCRKPPANPIFPS